MANINCSLDIPSTFTTPMRAWLFATSPTVSLLSACYIVPQYKLQRLPLVSVVLRTTSVQSVLSCKWQQIQSVLAQNIDGLTRIFTSNNIGLKDEILFHSCVLRTTVSSNICDLSTKGVEITPSTNFKHRKLKMESIVVWMRQIIEVDLSHITHCRKKVMLLENCRALRYHFNLRFYPCITVTQERTYLPAMLMDRLCK